MVEVTHHNMSYGYYSPHQSNYSTPPPAPPINHQQKLTHQDYSRTIPSSRYQYSSTWHPRPPPPNYENFTNSSPPQPPTLTPHHPSEGNSMVDPGCMCSSCSRPPQYHPPSLPHPHYSHQASWPPQQQPFSSPVSVGAHSDYQQNPPSWSTPGMATMTAYERNNNEPSMVTSNRYTPMQDSSRYSSIAESPRYISVSESRHTPVQDSMPSDPREWTSSDVQRWIQWSSMAFKLKVIPSDRFQMNGKALCLMDLSMFMFRVPDGGERLYDDFQTRLKKVFHDQPPKIN